MITLHDIVHLPELAGWFERIAREPRGLVVVAGLGTDGPGGVVGILCRQMLDVPRADDRPRRAVAVGTRRRFVHAGRGQERRLRGVLVGSDKAPGYAEAWGAAEAQAPDLVVIDELNPESLPGALGLAARALVLAPLDSLLTGGAVLQQLLDLGAAEALLAHVRWVVSVRRLPALCPHCREPWQAGPGAPTLFRNRGCPACEGDAPRRFVTAFDVFQHEPEAGPVAMQAERPSVLPLRAYAEALAAQALIPADEALALEARELCRAQRALSERQQALGRAEAELQGKAATLEASQRVLATRTQALVSLQDVAQTLAASTDLDDLARCVLRYARQALDADMVTLCLIEPDGSGRVAALSGWSPEALGRQLPGEEVARWLARTRMGRESTLAGDEAPSAVHRLPSTAEGARGGLLLALVAHGQPVGLLFAHSSLKRRFRQSEKSLLEMFADQAAVAIQRARLIADLQAKIAALEAAQAEIVVKERLEHELRLARELQESMLPARLPDLPGLQLAARSVPAREVGGDFYDAFALEGRRVGLVIADVAGKGLPAALFMALTRSLVRAEALREPSPARVLANVNRLLVEMSDSGVFVTAFYGVLQIAQGEMVYARAGHERPLHYRPADGRCTPLPGGGIALAVLPTVELEERRVALAPGDEVLLFTDGVTDAPLPGGAAYGHGRLGQALADHCSLDVDAQCRALLAEVAGLHGGDEPFDDAAVLLARYGEAENEKKREPPAGLPSVG